MSHPFTLWQEAFPIEQLSAPAAPSSPVPEHSPRPKRQHPSPDPVEDMPLGRTTSKATSEGPPSSKQWEIPPWYKVLKMRHSEAFSWDTSLVRETRKEYFKRHSPNFTMDFSHDLSRSSGIWWRQLGYWAWPFTKSRKYGRGQMSCNKLTMIWGLYLKASNSSKQYPHWSSQRLWVWWPYMTQMPFAASMAWLTAPGVGRRGQSSTTFGQCTTGSAWCATNVTTICQPHQTPSVTMAGRTVNP